MSESTSIDVNPRAAATTSTPPTGFAPLPPWRFRAMLGVGILAVALMPVALSPFRLFLVSLIICYVIAAVGLNLLIGYSGQISVAHAALMGFGAYSTALLMSLAGVTFVLAITIASVLTAGVGCLVAVPALRIRGHYLALATLAFQFIVMRIISQWVDVTGGPNGLRVPSATFFGIPLDDTGIYWLVAVSFLGALVVARNLSRSRFGRALIAVREDELLAQVMGVGLTRYKVLVFAVSAFYAGFAGGLFAVTVSFLDPASFFLFVSISFLVMVIFGGLGTVVGPILGAVLVIGAPEFFRGFEEYWPLVYSLVLIVVLLFLPIGVIGGLQRALRRIVPGAVLRSRYEVGAVEVPAGDAVVEYLPTLEGRAGGDPVGTDEERVLLGVRDVSLAFGGLQALSKVNLDLHEGEIAGLIGPNGAGKTTLFNVMTRVLTPDTGTVEFDGHDLGEYRTHQIVALGLSRTFQNVEVCDTLSVAENVILGMHHRLSSGVLRSILRPPSTGAEEAQASLEARHLLAELGLAVHAETPVGELPLGLQRRVEIARALASQPRALLLDEPASGLSQSEAVELMSDIRGLRERGITVLVIEHNVRFVMGLCTRVTVLDQGKVIYHGTPAGAQSDERVIEAYLGRDDDEDEEIADAHR